MEVIFLGIEDKVRKGRKKYRNELDTIFGFREEK